MFNAGGSSVVVGLSLKKRRMLELPHTGSVMQSKALQNVAIIGSHSQFSFETIFVFQSPGSFVAELRSKLCFAIVLCGNAIGN